MNGGPPNRNSRQNTAACSEVGALSRSKSASAPIMFSEDLTYTDGLHETDCIGNGGAPSS